MTHDPDFSHQFQNRDEWMPTAPDGKAAPKPELTKGQRITAAIIAAIIALVLIALLLPLAGWAFYHLIVPLYRWGF